MRQTHLGGDKLFVDYAGDTVPVVVDRHSGRIQNGAITKLEGGEPITASHVAAWRREIAELKRRIGGLE